MGKTYKTIQDIFEPLTMINEPNPIDIKSIKPDRKQIECLVDQLIKLNESYIKTHYGTTYTNDEITNAMKIINKGLEQVVTPVLILKGDK